MLLSHQFRDGYFAHWNRQRIYHLICLLMFLVHSYLFQRVFTCAIALDQGLFPTGMVILLWHLTVFFDACNHIMKVSPFDYVILHFCDLSPVFYQKIAPRMIISDNIRSTMINGFKCYLEFFPVSCAYSAFACWNSISCTLHFHLHLRSVGFLCTTTVMKFIWLTWAGNTTSVIDTSRKDYSSSTHQHRCPGDDSQCQKDHRRWNTALQVEFDNRPPCSRSETASCDPCLMYWVIYNIDAR